MMKLYMRNFIVVLLGVVFFNSAEAQTKKYSSSSKGAIKAFEEGLTYYDNKNFIKAIQLFQTAIKKDTSFIEAYTILAETATMNQQYDLAIENYKKAIAISPTFFPNNFYQLGMLQAKTGNYTDALESYNNYLVYVKTIPAYRKKQVNNKIAGCKFSIDAMQHPVPFDPKNLGDGINTKKNEYYPSFTVDQQEIIFTRDIPFKSSIEGHQEDFFISKKKNNTWATAYNAGNPLNSELNEGAPSISADGKLLFFTACDRDDGKGSCDIYLSQRQDDGNWSKPINLGEPINTNSWESQPSFSSDGKTLYFIREVKDRVNGSQQDIFVSTFQADRTWSNPVPLSATINTEGREESVFIHPDNQTLYFSSDGHPGLGGLDIFYSRRQADGNWGTPINLGYPINTSSDENSIVVSADGKLAYFASNRDSGFGGLDLYSFDLYKEAQPVLVSYVKAKVIDAITKLPLAAQFEIIDIETGKAILNNSTDKKRGEFMGCLPSGKNYMLNVNKEGYLFYSDFFECKNVTDKQNAYELLVPLVKPIAGQKVVLKNIFFDINKSDLQPISAAELDKLVALLKSNPNLKIEIGGHTDNTGDKKSNLLLSQRRALSVMNYLSNHGIDVNRLTAKGYGDTNPIATNDTEEGRSENRRTEFLIL